MLISGRLSLQLCNCLEILGDVLVRNNLMLFSTSSLFFHFCFAVMWTRGEIPASQTGVDIRI